jgi:hypothetical protein
MGGLLNIFEWRCFLVGALLDIGRLDLCWDVDGRVAGYLIFGRLCLCVAFAMGPVKGSSRLPNPGVETSSNVIPPCHNATNPTLGFPLAPNYLSSWL